MATAREITEPYLQIYTPVPPGIPPVCRICHSVPNEGFDVCYSCHVTRRQVTEPLDSIVPISLYRLGEQLHTWLAGYKRWGPSTQRQQVRVWLTATIARFLRQHHSCIARNGWDVITYVPSTRADARGHALFECLRNMPVYGDRCATLLKRGTASIDHLNADDAGFEVTESVGAERVLLIDDTFTSGARMQSAASALRLAGADVIAAVPVGRVITPGFSLRHEEFWRHSRSIAFSFDTCCLDASPWRLDI